MNLYIELLKITGETINKCFFDRSLLEEPLFEGKILEEMVPIIYEYSSEITSSYPFVLFGTKIYDLKIFPSHRRFA